MSPQHFIENHCHIYDGETGDWIPFTLWPEQVEVLNALHDNQRVVILKARQLGLTWLMLSYALWLMLFEPIATVLLFSKRDDEAVYLAGEERLRGMWRKLPDWLKSGHDVVRDDAHVFSLSNGSTVRAFPTSAGDSYTATFAVVDEADLVPNLSRLLLSVKPTVDAGGKLALISKADKSRPNSRFKKIYNSAKSEPDKGWVPLFLPWHVRPGRTQSWYERERAAIIRETGGDDDMKENYPATDVEAMAPRQLDKRLPSAWLDTCYEEGTPLSSDGTPAVANLTVYAAPESGVTYIAGADCAEGLPSSDDSVTQWIRTDTGEQVAKLVGKIQPEQHAIDTQIVCQWYNNALCLVERNNHGHSFISNAQQVGLPLVTGLDKRPGWQTNKISKAALYTDGAGVFRDGGTIIHDYRTYTQLASIERSSLKAPEGEMDDEAVAFMLALQAAMTSGPIEWLVL